MSRIHFIVVVLFFTGVAHAGWPDLACRSHEGVALYGAPPTSWADISKQGWRFKLAESLPSVAKWKTSLGSHEKKVLFEAHRIGERHRDGNNRPTIAGLRHQFRYLKSEGVPDEAIRDLLRFGICGEVEERAFVESMVGTAAKQVAGAWADYLLENGIRPAHAKYLTALHEGRIGTSEEIANAIADIRQELNVPEEVQFTLSKGSVAVIRIYSPPQSLHFRNARLAVPLARKYAPTVTGVVFHNGQTETVRLPTGGSSPTVELFATLAYRGNSVGLNALERFETDGTFVASVFAAVEAQLPHPPNPKFLRYLRDMDRSTPSDERVLVDIFLLAHGVKSEIFFTDRVIVHLEKTTPFMVNFLSDSQTRQRFVNGFHPYLNDETWMNIPNPASPELDDVFFDLYKALYEKSTTSNTRSDGLMGMYYYADKELPRAVAFVTELEQRLAILKPSEPECVKILTMMSLATFTNPRLVLAMVALLDRTGEKIDDDNNFLIRFLSRAGNVEDFKQLYGGRFHPSSPILVKPFVNAVNRVNAGLTIVELAKHIGAEPDARSKFAILVLAELAGDKSSPMKTRALSALLAADSRAVGADVYRRILVTRAGDLSEAQKTEVERLAK